MRVKQVVADVIYALPAEQRRIQVILPPGATIEQAIRLSGILELYPAIDLGKCQVGVFGRFRQLEDPVQEGDRIEIYRPLVIDPKEGRRRRAESAESN